MRDGHLQARRSKKKKDRTTGSRKWQGHTKERFWLFYHIGLMKAPVYLGDVCFVSGVSTLPSLFGIAISKRFYRLSGHDRRTSITNTRHHTSLPRRALILPVVPLLTYLCFPFSRMEINTKVGRGPLSLPSDTVPDLLGSIFSPHDVW